MKRTISAVLACILALTLSPAIAGPVASASISGYGYELIDLDPNDGIAPSITLTRQSVWVSSVEYREMPGSPYLRQLLRGVGTTEVADAAGYARAEGALDGAVASARAFHHHFLADAVLWQDFVLSPFTTVIFRAHGTGTQNAPRGNSFGGAQLVAYYGLDEDGNDAYFVDETGYGFNPVSRDLILSITSGASEISGVTGFNVYANSGNEAITIPEPSSIATLLAGLCIIQVSRRKRLRAPKVQALS